MTRNRSDLNLELFKNVRPIYVKSNTVQSISIPTHNRSLQSWYDQIKTMKHRHFSD